MKYGIIIVSYIAWLSLGEFRNAMYNPAGHRDIDDGPEYDGLLYDSVISCGLKCLPDGCGYFAASQAVGGVRCVFDTLDLPRGHWDIYGNLPGKYGHAEP